ncbi:MAG: hypothetical protein COB78_12685 [Hyphomicrobiales bacterium]|nr:MAG: hypothetical protein COB78_12685 [Hyphomicrobiales bacterium]
MTKRNQNLIFARNGVGKSFLSRAFRYLDLHGQGKDVSEAARNLVSDESADGKGKLSFSRGTQVMGELQLNKAGDTVTAQITDTIFHVFSEDFVQEELREQEYNLDGEIENQISVDSQSINVKDAQEALEKSQSLEQKAAKVLKDKFDLEKIAELHEKAGINKQLKDYKALNFERLLEHFTQKPDLPERCLTDVLKDLDRLKAIPAEPVYPQAVSFVQIDDFNIEALSNVLEKITSPSSVSESIKDKIDAHHGFYEAGAAIVQDEHRTTCPFCEQGITNADPKAVIDAYTTYFADEEEKHKAELRGFYRALSKKEDELAKTEIQLARQKLKYNDLRSYVPSKRDIELDDSEVQFKDVGVAIALIKNVITVKAGNLTVETSLQDNDLAALIIVLNKTIEGNNTKVAELNKAVEKSDEERKTLQREACTKFECEFTINYWVEIEEIRTLHLETKHKEEELSALEKLNPSTDARTRVADTFELLLREFFADKYVFDKEKFTLKRGDYEMARGSHRTLSDGEKTAIAFCYFVACLHRKVVANSDYQRLFLVFDDPVTSMSYDFVFAIAQTLKNLSISKQGEISINPSLIDGNKYVRPELLILTHSSYFFNISLTNRVVNGDAAFAFLVENKVHKVTPLNTYVAPFQQQLKDVYEIANGREPDHNSGNAIRSVLEAVGRFCRPDKSDSLTNFVKFLAGEDGIGLKSVLINSLCHGTYLEETPPPDDIRQACEETIVVVEKYAAGQIEIIKAAAIKLQ